VRIYLSTSGDGSNSNHEFDIFHDVPLDKSGSVSVTGRYLVPYSIVAGNNYWVVVEIAPDGKVIESGENKTMTTAIISVPCDKFAGYDDSADYHCRPNENF